MLEKLFITLFLLSSASCFSPIPNHYSFISTSIKSANFEGEHYHHHQNQNQSQNLSVLFQRAVIQQRSGDHQKALQDYQLFLKAAKQCNISPKLYAEVHVNMGAVYFKDKAVDMAKRHFEKALEHRETGAAYVNLALISLQKGSETLDPRTGVDYLREAKLYCEKSVCVAMKEEDSTMKDESKDTAMELLEKIEDMLEKMSS